MEHNTIVAALLGLVEGLTEFIPVSSTGHLLLIGHFLGFNSPGHVFEVVIQLGAIFAILGVYAGKLYQLFTTAPTNPRSRHFILAVVLAFLPAAVIGALAHNFIKTVLFDSPRLIAIMLIVGGVVLLFVDKIANNPKYDNPEDFPLGMAFAIGLIQCLAMIPGVSRSGATIVGALSLGASKKAAAEFSFFLSMPTMLGAFIFDLMKNRDALSGAAVTDIIVGFLGAFLAAVVVVKWLLNYLSNHGYGLFAWWRIIVGTVALLALSAGR